MEQEFCTDANKVWHPRTKFKVTERRRQGSLFYVFTGLDCELELSGASTFSWTQACETSK